MSEIADTGPAANAPIPDRPAVVHGPYIDLQAHIDATTPIVHRTYPEDEQVGIHIGNGHTGQMILYMDRHVLATAIQALTAAETDLSRTVEEMHRAEASEL